VHEYLFRLFIYCFYQQDGGSDKDLLRKIDDLKEDCGKYEHEIDQMKDEFKLMRRERDKFRDKYDNLNEEFKEIKRELDREKPGRSLHWNSNSPEEHYRKDSR
jgi:chromosome segregation ATPase